MTGILVSCYSEDMDSHEDKLKGQKPVPIEFAGKWIAWNEDHSRIIASGSSIREAWDVACATGERDPIFEKVPRVDVCFVGTRLVSHGAA